MKGVYVGDLTPGSPFKNSVFLIRNATVRTAKTGSVYLACSLVDRTGSVNAKQFNLSEAQQRVALTARFIKASGRMQAGDFEGDVCLDNLQAIEQPADIEPFIEPLPHNAVQQQGDFQSMVASVRQPFLLSLLKLIFGSEGEVWPRFCNAVAASKLHHSHRGGLLEHTLEVANLCDATCGVIPSLRRDFLIASALLHDLGKLDEMDHGLAAGEYSEAGNLIGHIVLGTNQIATAADSIPGFPVELKHGIMHMVLSHHGKLEFGSPRFPQCAEAQVLAANDQLSARLDQCGTALANALDGHHTVAVSGWDSRYMHCGDFGLD